MTSAEPWSLSPSSTKGNITRLFSFGHIVKNSGSRPPSPFSEKLRKLTSTLRETECSKHKHDLHPEKTASDVPTEHEHGHHRGVGSTDKEHLGISMIGTNRAQDTRVEVLDKRISRKNGVFSTPRKSGRNDVKQKFSRDFKCSMTADKMRQAEHDLKRDLCKRSSLEVGPEMTVNDTESEQSREDRSYAHSPDTDILSATTSKRDAECYQGEPSFHDYRPHLLGYPGKAKNPQREDIPVNCICECWPCSVCSGVTPSNTQDEARCENRHSECSVDPVADVPRTTVDTAASGNPETFREHRRGDHKNMPQTNSFVKKKTAVPLRLEKTESTQYRHGTSPFTLEATDRATNDETKRSRIIEKTILNRERTTVTLKDYPPCKAATMQRSCEGGMVNAATDSASVAVMRAIPSNQEQKDYVHLVNTKKSPCIDQPGFRPQSRKGKSADSCGCHPNSAVTDTKSRDNHTSSPNHSSYLKGLPTPKDEKIVRVFALEHSRENDEGHDLAIHDSTEELSHGSSAFLKLSESPLPPASQRGLAAASASSTMSEFTHIVKHRAAAVFTVLLVLLLLALTLVFVTSRLLHKAEGLFNHRRLAAVQTHPDAASMNVTESWNDIIEEIYKTETDEFTLDVYD